MSPSQLSQLVRINEAGLVANAVNLEMITDPEKNLRLCQGFVFNYNPDQPKDSTIGVLDLLRRSYHSPKEENIHLMIQTFGKGKSHLALTVANYFQQPYDSDEVKGILSQIESATNGKTGGAAVFENFRAYKQRSNPFLVISISGEDGVDLKKMFLRSLRTALDAEGIQNSIAHSLVQDPLNYLKEVSENPEKRAKAEAYLIYYFL